MSHNLADLAVAAEDRVDPARARLRRQVEAVFVERGAARGSGGRRRRVRGRSCRRGLRRGDRLEVVEQNLGIDPAQLAGALADRGGELVVVDQRRQQVRRGDVARALTEAGEQPRLAHPADQPRR